MPKEFLITDDGDISDGQHSFGELYEHRFALYLALVRSIEKINPNRVWRSKYHSDGGWYPGWFLLGINKKPGQQITYHLPMRLWDDVSFVRELGRAPEFDGHSSADVLARLHRL